MTTDAVAIRAALAARLPGLVGIAGVSRTTPVPQISASDLPKLSVFILREQMSPDGDSNAGEPRFIDDITIGVSIARGGKPADLDAAMDQDIAAVESVFTDPTFVTFGQDCLFESIEGVTNARLFPKDGETYFGETRVEITFRTRVSFPPAVTDNFDAAQITARNDGGASDDLTIIIEPEHD